MFLTRIMERRRLIFEIYLVKEFGFHSVGHGKGHLAEMRWLEDGYLQHLLVMAIDSDR